MITFYLLTACGDIQSKPQYQDLQNKGYEQKLVELEENEDPVSFSDLNERSPTSFSVSNNVPLSGSKDVRVMIYNIHGIPCLKKSFFSRLLRLFKVAQCPDNTVWSRSLEDRLKELGHILDKMEQDGELPDVLLLQEAFLARLSLLDDGPLKRFIISSPYPYRVKGPKSVLGNNLKSLFALLKHGAKAKGAVDAGIIVLSKHPIIKTQRIPFKTCRDSDCLANKGVVYAKIQFPGMPAPVDFYTTHMQAGQRFDSMRLPQNDVFVRLLKADSHPSPWLIAGGDFNFRNQGGYPSYADFVNKTELDHVGQRCLKTNGCSRSKGTKLDWMRGSLLDHQFTSSKGKDVSIKPLYVEYDDFPFRNGKLSDHPYMIVDYQLNW